MLWLQILAGVLGSALILILVAVRRAKPEDEFDPTAFALEEPHILLRKAYVQDKGAAQIKTGDDLVPSHRLAFYASFELEEGGEEVLELPEADFTTLTVGVWGALATQAGNFLGFTAGG